MAAQTRKKVGSVPTTVAVAELRILVSFNGMLAGDQAVLDPDDPQVQGWVNAGLAEIVTVHDVPMELTLEVDGGEDPAGPGEPEPDVQGAGEA